MFDSVYANAVTSQDSGEPQSNMMCGTVSTC